MTIPLAPPKQTPLPPPKQVANLAFIMEPCLNPAMEAQASSGVALARFGLGRSRGLLIAQDSSSSYEDWTVPATINFLQRIWRITPK